LTFPFPIRPPGGTTVQIARSLRFNAADTAYLSRTFAAPTAAGIMTLAFWLKLDQRLGVADRDIFSGTPSDGNYSRVHLAADDKLYVYTGTGVGPNSTRVFRDPTAWYHIVIAIDLTQATAANRVRMWVNGVQETLAGTQPAMGSTTYFNANTNKHAIMQLANYINQQGGGYLADFHFIDGQSLPATNFGEVSAITGAWVPKNYAGTYGNNGFRLTFSDSSAATAAALGKDTSGRGKAPTPGSAARCAATTRRCRRCMWRRRPCARWQTATWTSRFPTASIWAVALRRSC
jgi:hypothetical protein